MTIPANYVLGRSTHEYERLTLQARILRPYTEKFFRSAGIVPGMRVLEIGSGMGDVALLTADIVGPAGAVVGLDRDAAGLERARARTVENGCSSWVSFQAIDLDDFSAAEPFDAIAGRLVLMYQPDAAATLRQLLSLLKPGGIAVFHEMDFTEEDPSYPPCDMWDQAYRLLGEVFRRGGAPPDFGRRLGRTFVDAGLPFPSVVAEAVIGGAAGSYVYPWIANTLISVASRMADLALTLPHGLVIDEALAGKLEKAVLEHGSQIIGPVQYGAWARKRQ